MSGRLLAYCLLIVIASLGGGMIPLVRVVTHIRMQIYLSFSAGVMLGSALLHMLPEAAEIGGPGAIAWSLPGLVTLFMIERFFSFHHHEFEEPQPNTDPPGHANGIDHHDHSHPHHHTNAEPHSQNAKYQWKAATVGLTLHSLLGGLALASAEAASADAAWTVSSGVFLATLLHKPADALTITSLMKRGRTGSSLAHLVNLIFALMIPLGAILFQLGKARLSMLPQESIQAITGSALAFSAGTFLCVSLSDLLPELHFHSHDRVKLSLSLLSGILLMAIVAFFGE